MSFGADTDYWGFADTNAHLISSSESPNKSEAQCSDSFGDVEASTMYDTFSDITCVYGLCAQTISIYDTSGTDFRLGTVIGGNVILSHELSTENTAYPTFTITGRTCPAADSDVSKYAPTGIEVAVSRRATGFGYTVDTNTRLTGSSITESVSAAIQLDSAGATACMDVYGGRVEASNDLVGCGGDIGGSVDTGWTLSAGPSMDQENTGYATGSVTVFQNVART